MITPEVPYQVAIAFLIIRLIAGTLFFLQGYDKLFNVGINGVFNAFSEPMRKHHIPGFMLYVAAWLTTLIELIGGGMLLLGFLTGWASLLLMFDLLLVSVAFGLLEPMWDMKHVFPRLVFLLIVIVLFQFNLFSIDYLIFK